MGHTHHSRSLHHHMPAAKHFHVPPGQKVERRYGRQYQVLCVPQARCLELDCAEADPVQLLFPISNQVRHSVVLCAVAYDADTDCHDRTAEGQETYALEGGVSAILCQTVGQIASALQWVCLDQLQLQEEHRLQEMAGRRVGSKF